ncbi:MAG: phage terminase large subunit family protein [Thermodesulfobacteriota bacterium]|nr:phage terminase large subunit family protein [Thermodesulfobacteriota bacterium]
MENNIQTIDATQNLDFLAARMLNTWRPAKPITGTKWAESNRVLSKENCPLPGPYRVAVTPYIEEILNCVMDPMIEKVVCQKSAQVAWTDGVVNNCVGYYVDHEPSPMLILFPTSKMAERYSKEKLAPMIRDCIALRGKIAEPKSRDSGNTILSKNFTGGHLELIGSNAPANLSMSPIRIVIVEEPDRCAANAGGEGNSLKIAFERTKAFHNRKIILGGSPTIKGLSEIEREMKLTDQRRFLIPCPICGEYQELKWSSVVWDKKPGRNHLVYDDYLPESAMLRCISCEKEFSNAEKNEQLSRGIWHPTAEFTGAAGFYLSELLSPLPNSKLSDIAKKFLEARKELKAGNELLMITFINTALGETWEEKGEGIEQRDIIERVETYRKNAIDPGILAITSAVDVQDDRLECEIVGWGMGEESWSLDYLIIEGDPEQPGVWKKLDKVLERTFKRSGALLKIACMCVDSGAHTNAVYKYVLPRQVRRVYAIKGKSTEGDPIVGRPSRRSIMKGLKLYPVGTDTAKTAVYGRLKVEKPGPGYCHFPDHYPDEYFKQLTAEELVTRYVRGVTKRVWKKKRPRNEALDLRVYNLAALNILNPNFKVLQAKAEKVKKEKPKDSMRAPRPRRRKNFVTNY